MPKYETGLGFLAEKVDHALNGDPRAARAGRVVPKGAPPQGIDPRAARTQATQERRRSASYSGGAPRHGATRARGGNLTDPSGAQPTRLANIISFVDKHAWNIQAAVGLIDRLSDAVDSSLPSFSHSISVTVQGGPQADLRRVWYLCLAAAFGRYRNRVRSIQTSTLEAQWDVTGKSCTVSIGYVVTGALGAANAGFGSEISSPMQLVQRGPDQVTVGGSWAGWLTATQGSGFFTTNGPLQAIGGWIHSVKQRLLDGISGTGTTVVGPNGFYLLKSRGVVNPAAPNVIANSQWTPVFESEDELTPELLYKFVQDFRSAKNLFVELPVLSGSNGGQFLPWSRVLPIGTGTFGGGRIGSVQNDGKQLPTLPDDGRVITTGQKLQPLVQNPRPPIDGKTRAGFIALVAQSLSNPGFLPPTPPGGFVPLGSPGVQVYLPGQGLEDEQWNRGAFTNAVQATSDELDLPGAVGPTQPPVTPEGFGIDGMLVPKQIPNIRNESLNDG